MYWNRETLANFTYGTRELGLRIVLANERLELRHGVLLAQAEGNLLEEELVVDIVEQVVRALGALGAAVVVVDELKMVP